MQTDHIAEPPLGVVREEVANLARLVWGDGITRRFATLVLSCCAAIIALHVAGLLMPQDVKLGRMIWNNFNVTGEGNLAAHFGYGLLFLSMMLFVVSAMVSGSRAAVFCAAVCGFLWMDDSIQYHEKMAGKLIPLLGLEDRLGLRGQDVGELLAWGLAGAVLLVVLIHALRQRRPGDIGLLVVAIACFAGLTVFGGFVDMLHSIFVDQHDALIGLLEDGGELLVMGVIAALSLGVLRKSETYFD